MNLKIFTLKTIALLLLAFTFSEETKAQQDPQYTQYMYNTMSVNPGYSGTRGNFSIFGLHRSQWLGIDGAPQTQSLGIESPLSNNVGLGLNIVNDNLGPAQRFQADGNFSYTIKTGLETNLSFGLKAGIRYLDVDFSKGTAAQQNDPNLTDIDSKLSPAVGLGFYYHHTTKWYVGLSLPNILTTKYYSDVQEDVAQERLHFFLIAGYVFDINDNLKFKPALLSKIVSGAPLSADISANFLYKEKLTLGVSYRLSDAVSGLAGFQITDGLFAGYAYDFTTSGLTNGLSSGSHEIMLRFDLAKSKKIIRIVSPRFY
ncbi:type IX secretion system membrane protein PorP/SprF [Aurantibacter sp.]|uniref:PorP/SprF family type IX secretion system membrane protein n=1 Tax=Aurantibacter sp. TaxID=2807103 RepID=UPI00326320D4